MLRITAHHRYVLTLLGIEFLYGTLVFAKVLLCLGRSSREIQHALRKKESQNGACRRAVWLSPLPRLVVRNSALYMELHFGATLQGRAVSEQKYVKIPKFSGREKVKMESQIGPFFLLWNGSPKWSSIESWVTDNQMALHFGSRFFEDRFRFSLHETHQLMFFYKTVVKKILKMASYY